MIGALVGVATGVRSVSADEAMWLRAGVPGRIACGAQSPDWLAINADERKFSDRSVGPEAGTSCSGTELLRWRFLVPRNASRAVITLRVRYQHGFVAYLDGVEIARRNVAVGAPTEALATDVHGLEWERFRIAESALLPGEAHVLAVEAHPHTAGHEPLIDVELSGADGPRIVRGPYLLEVTTRGARIAFETDVPSMATLSYSADRELGTTAVEDKPGLSKHHQFKLGGLRAATAYFYQATARSPGLVPVASTDVVPMHTPPDRGRPLRFVIYGDVRSGHDVHAEVVRSIRAEDPDLAISTGDLVDMGSDEAEWDRYFEVADPLLGSIPVYVAVGNHEYARGGQGIEHYRALFGPESPAAPLWGSFDVAGVHFVYLDSTRYGSPEQLAWLKRDLETLKGARAIFVYAHHGAYTSGLHGDNEVAKASYVPVLEHYGVTLFVGGHDHHYERGKVGTLDYMVSGGGGAELRVQRCGVPGKKPCLPRVARFINEHHYVLVEVLPKLVRICPKRPDGTPLEACYTMPLPR